MPKPANHLRERQVFNLKTFKVFIPVFLLLVAVFSYLSPLIATSESVSDKVFRLHILANSDTKNDQSLKLKVRDYVLENSDFFAQCETVDDAIIAAKVNINDIEALANECIKINGYDYEAEAHVAYEYFNTRVYDSITLPAGYYNSLKIEIGQAKGQNWWCIVFPAVCLSACTEDDLSSYLDEDEINLIENKDGFAIRFKAVEIYEKIKDKLR